MTTIATRGGVRLGHIIQWEEAVHLGFSRENIVVNEAAATTYQLGEVLGKITATGKYVRIAPTATDGSQNFAGIFIGTDDAYNPDVLTLTAGVDAKAVVLVKEAAVGVAYLRFTAGVTPVQKQAIYAQIKAANIKLIAQETGIEA